MRSFVSSIQFIAINLLVCIITTGCMVGPDFHTPAAPQTKKYTERPLPAKTAHSAASGPAGKTQYFAAGKDIPAEWWFLFHSQTLNSLISLGLDNSPNLAAAKAALRQAEETLYAQIGNLMLPAISAQMLAQRQRFSTASFGRTSPATVFNFFNPAFNLSYTLDVFGGSRRQLESLRAQVDYQAFELEAAYLTLTSNIATMAITAASYKAQIHATQQLIKAQQDTLGIVEQQFDLGAASGADVYTQETQLAQTRASLPPLEQNLAQTLHVLATLVGIFPGDNHLPLIELDKLHLPAELPVSLPSSLAHQRPDVRASEALLHVASAQVGVATANLFPQITLTGNYGWQNDSMASLINPNNLVWTYGGQILQPLFNGGALRAKRRAAIAGFEQAAAQYRQVVLQAFQNVADILRAIENDALELRVQKQAQRAAGRTLAMTKKQYRSGGVSYLTLLNAERQYQQVQIALIQSQAARYNDTVALFQALGGGWWNRK